MPEKSEPNKQIVDLIKRLSLAVGVTGYTGPNSVQEVVTAELTPYVDRVERDRMGSVIGLKQGGPARPVEPPGRNPRVMLAAHLDEIGAVVTKLDAGFVRFGRIGGLDSRVLMGQEVIVHGRRDLPGIIGSIPPHLLPSDKPNTVKMEELLIDVGLPAEQLNRLVQVGDIISFARTPAELLNGLLSGKAMDNRASVACMIATLKELQKLHHQWDVYAVATACEEWGNYVGATTQAYAVRPDVAIALDVTFADLSETDIKLNDGPAITMGPSNHPVIRERLMDICRDLELKYQEEVVSSGSGTDAYAIEISREGIPTLLIGVPSRYMHSPVETIAVRDVERIGRLVAHFIASLDDTFIEKLIPR